MRLRSFVLAAIVTAAVASPAASVVSMAEERAAHASPATTGKPRKSVSIGNMDELECFGELKKLKIPHVRAPGAPKIDMPIILTGPINGVHFDTGRPYK